MQAWARLGGQEPARAARDRVHQDPLPLAEGAAARNAGRSENLTNHVDFPTLLFRTTSLRSFNLVDVLAPRAAERCRGAREEGLWALIV